MLRSLLLLAGVVLLPAARCEPKSPALPSAAPDPVVSPFVDRYGITTPAPTSTRRAKPQWQRKYEMDLVRAEPIVTDIREVLKDPAKYADKKIRIVGWIASSFEYAELVDGRAKERPAGEGRLRIWPAFLPGLGSFLEKEDPEFFERASKGQAKEYLGYLEWGGRFGHMGGWPMQFTIVEMYPARAPAAEKAAIKKKYLDYLEEFTKDQPIPDLVETAEIRRVRQSLQGQWTLIEAKGGGVMLSMRSPSRWTISGNQLNTGAGGDYSRAHIVVDPSRMPAAVDCWIGGSRSLVFGIFSLEGDTLRLCLSSGEHRPREFYANRFSDTELIILRREYRSAAEDRRPRDDLDVIGNMEAGITWETDTQGRIVGAVVQGKQVQGTRIVADSQLAALARLRNLDHATIWGRVTDAGIGHLARCGNLVSLSLGNDGMTDAAIAHLRELSRLQSIDLSQSSVSDAGLVHLGQLTNLKTLTLRDTKISGAGLANLKGLTKLETLDLSGSQVNDAGLAQLHGPTALKTLSLDGTRVTDAGLIQLVGLPNLEDLTVSDLPITNAGLQTLKTLPRLEVLCLEGTRIDNRGLESLKSFPRLRAVTLSRPRVTRDAARDLREALPKVVVEYDGSRLESSNR